MNPTLSVRTVAARMLFMAALATAILIIGSMIVAGDRRSLQSAAPMIVATTLIAWVLFWNPRLIIADGGLWVRNPLQTTHVPWPTFDSATVGWNLQLLTADRKISVWALPRDSASGRWLAQRRTSSGTHPHSAFAAKTAIDDRFGSLQQAGHLQHSPRGVVSESVTINRLPCLALAAALILAVAGIWMGVTGGA